MHHHSLFPPLPRHWQAITYGVPITVAIKSGITCSTTAMYALVAWWKARNNDDTDAGLAACALLDLSSTVSKLGPNATKKVSPTQPASKKPSNLLSPTQHVTKKPASDQLPSVTPSRSARKGSNSADLAISKLLAWMDRDTITSALGKRKQRTITQMAQDDFDKNQSAATTEPAIQMHGRVGPNTTMIS